MLGGTLTPHHTIKWSERAKKKTTTAASKQNKNRTKLDMVEDNEMQTPSDLKGLGGQSIEIEKGAYENIRRCRRTGDFIHFFFSSIPCV